MALKRKPQAAPIASQITKNRTMKMTLRRLLLSISLYTSRILLGEGEADRQQRDESHLHLAPGSFVLVC